MDHIERPELVRAVVALGSNLGERSATILSGLSVLAQQEGVKLLAISDLHETTAVKLTGPDEDAPRYLNAVAIVETSLDPESLLTLLLSIEAQFGRTREAVWGDRTLDLDLIDYDGREYASTTLLLPHPRASERVFVLAPWLEVDPSAEVVGAGPVRALLEGLRAGTPPVND